MASGEAARCGCGWCGAGLGDPTPGPVGSLGGFASVRCCPGGCYLQDWGGWGREGSVGAMRLAHLLPWDSCQPCPGLSTQPNSLTASPKPYCCPRGEQKTPLLGFSASEAEVRV